MCSISGIYNPTGLFEKSGKTADAMSNVLCHRGPDDHGKADFRFCTLRHNRLSVMDPLRGAQPMTASFGGKTYTVVYNGELYQTEALRLDLEKAGVLFKTTCDTEVLLYAYAVYGEAFLEKLNGIFAFAIYDHSEKTLFCARDRMGVKPFYFTYNCPFCQALCGICPLFLSSKAHFRRKKPRARYTRGFLSSEKPRRRTII